MIWVLLCVVMAVEDGAAQPAPPAPERIAFYETNIRPVLVEHCLDCHGPKKQWAGLRLDSRDALLTGGDSGAVIEPNSPAESLLLRAVRQTDEALSMPPESKLSDQQIADLARWIEWGAPFPETPAADTRTRDPNHWAFQPPKEHALPAVQQTDWPRTPIDHFILARLEQASLAPVAAADKRTLIRRVTFDLTGLPPTPAEVAAFLVDDRAEAYGELIERLLASPAYGERWGRHWLDVARYADSNGLDENIAHGNAWRYRDYVVAAFNTDKPYDQFLREQLAGDLLPAHDETQRYEQLIATGFLSIGPKVLAEVNQAKMQMDIVDEQLDTVGRVTMGLTIGCARCHDHKFDPVSTADYYGLAGIFKSTRTMETYTKVARWHEHELPNPTALTARAAHQSQVADQQKVIDALVASANQQVNNSLPARAAPPENLESAYPVATTAALKELREALAALQKAAPEFPAAMGVGEDQIIDVAIHVRGNPLKLGDVVARRTPTVLQGPQVPQFTPKESGRLQLADWLTDPRHPLTARVMVNRVWRWHFGKGLVGTTDNFGLLGEPPSHPELLDWLALQFIKDGWSIKSLHRQILLSSTYQQASQPSAEQLLHDPENRLHGHAAVRRLDAEEVRDSLLAVSGQLDMTMGGSLLKVANRGYLFDHTSIDLSDYNSTRRSLYLPVIRNNVYDLFQLLDFPDPAVPNGDRAATTVAPQALLMLNSELVMRAADGLAARLLAEPGDDALRLNSLYRTVYGREATSDEQQADLALLARAATALEATESNAELRRQKAWGLLCHTVLASNEFIYLQ